MCSVFRYDMVRSGDTSSRNLNDFEDEHTLHEIIPTRNGSEDHLLLFQLRGLSHDARRDNLNPVFKVSLMIST
jgi:hypothetical protein